jgi:hypothetical protein
VLTAIRCMDCTDCRVETTDGPDEIPELPELDQAALRTLDLAEEVYLVGIGSCACPTCQWIVARVRR